MSNVLRSMNSQNEIEFNAESIEELSARKLIVRFYEINS